MIGNYLENPTRAAPIRVIAIAMTSICIFRLPLISLKKKTLHIVAITPGTIALIGNVMA